MTHDADDGEPGTPDPWARGGSMSRAPISPADPVFPVTSSSPASPTESGPPGSPGSSGSSDSPGSPGSPWPSGSPGRVRPAIASSRTVRVAVVVTAALALVAAGVWVVGRDGPADDPVAEPPPTTSPLFDAPPTTARAQPAPEAEIEIEATPAASEWIGGDVGVTLPPAVRAIVPTEIVMLTGEDELVRVDTASGLLRTVLTNIPFDEPRLAVNDDAIVVWSRTSSEIIVLGGDEQATSVKTLLKVDGVVAEADGQFLLQSGAGQGEAYEVQFEPALRLAEIVFDVGNPFVVRPHPAGGLMVPGPDGTYLVDDGLQVRITDGGVVAEGRTHVMFRRCTDDGDCRLFVDDVPGGPQAELTAVPAERIVDDQLPDRVAPGGSAIFQLTSGDDGYALEIIELTTGESVELPVDQAAPPTSLRWAPDGSGLFGVVAGVVIFYERATGEVVALSDVGGSVRALGVRPASPVGGSPVSFEVELTGPTGLDLVGLTSRGDVVELDLDGRSFRTHPGMPLQSGTARTLVADGAGVTVAARDGTPGFRLDFGSTAVATDGAEIRGVVFPGPVPNTLWRNRASARADGVDVELIDVTGTELGPSIRIDGAWPLGSDGTGRLLLVGSGGIYVADPDGARRVTTGNPVATGPTVVYARECDETLDCEVVRIDRASGERLPVDPDLLDSAPTFQDIDLAGTTVSPDGDVVLVQAARNGLSWVFVDVAAGFALDAPGPRASTSVAWSADSAYAAYLSGERLWIYDRSAGRVTSLTDLPPLRAFTEVHRVADPPAELPF